LPPQAGENYLYRAFGEKAVLIPIPSGSKQATIKGWQKTTLAQTQRPEYQKRLSNGCNIAILNGPPSAGLCSIDIDDDRYLLEFLKLNPGLKGTTKSFGRRGCNFWVQVTGDYPQSVYKITTPDAKTPKGIAKVGEWRSGGGYTIVHGTHPEGGHYEVVGRRPREIAFSDIRFPEGWKLPWEEATPAPFSSSPTSSISPDTPSAPPETPNTSYTTTPLHPYTPT